MSFKNRLQAAMAKADVDQSELARRLSVSSQAVNQWVSGATIPRGRRLQTIADALGVRVTQLLESDELPLPAHPLASNARIALDAPPPPDFGAMPRDIPIYGSAQGGPNGAFSLNMLEGPIDWARQPPSLVGVNTVFAIYCDGESMSPWREPGALIYVSKVKPPNVGSHVVVVLEGDAQGEPPRAFVKKLIRRTAEKLELQQYNPPSLICLPMDRVREVLRVLEWEEVPGL